MIHILLTTLKVIGILLAITLALFIAIILIVLFVPVRYKAEVHNIDAKAKITWLLHLVTVNLEFKEKKFKYIIKILGITINKDKPKKEKKTNNISDQEVKKEPSLADKTKKVIKNDKNIDDKANKEVEETLNNETVEKKVEKKSISQKLYEAINNIKFKISKLCDKIKKIKNKISDYKDFLTTKEAKTNLNEIFRMLFDLIKYIIPTKLKGNLKFGFENPETTGKVLGGICLFYGIYGENIILEPDFENKVFEADVKMKGRVRLYRPLIVAFKLWRNTWIKKLIKFVKTH